MSSASSKLQKEFIGVAILHLQERGYGPEGKHTRSEWREACWTNLDAGKDAFSLWQHQWVEKIREDLPTVKYGFSLVFDDGSTQTFFDADWHSACAMDFVGQDFGLLHELRGVSDFQFSQSVLFAHAAIYDHAIFRNTQFSSDAHFDGARFHSEVNFSSTKFAKHTSFSDAIFSDSTSFKHVFFSERADFSNATFLADVDFSNAGFGGNASFRSSQFKADAFFTKATFHGLCHFQNHQDALLERWARETSFGNQADFENTVFENVGHFERVRFIKRVPSFLGVDNATTRLEFSDDSYFPKQDRTEDAVTRLGHLKRLADEHGQTDQALNFNALELHAKAGLPTTGSFTKFVTWVYGAVSDYGRSFTRPIATYVALLLITLLLATGHAAFSLPDKDCYGARWQILTDLLRTTAPCLPATDDKLHLSGYRAAAEYTLYRAAGVLDFSDNGKATDAVARRLFGQPIEPWWMRVWGVFKAIASTALLFLTVLGLRNKYRIK